MPCKQLIQKKRGFGTAFISFHDVCVLRVDTICSVIPWNIPLPLFRAAKLQLGLLSGGWPFSVTADKMLSQLSILRVLWFLSEKPK